MRGKHVMVDRAGKMNRITPAHAGKTLFISGLSRLLADHPRACGENLVQQLHIRTHLGSPPRMRGKP